MTIPNEAFEAVKRRFPYLRSGEILTVIEAAAPYIIRAALEQAAQACEGRLDRHERNVLGLHWENRPGHWAKQEEARACIETICALMPPLPAKDGT